MEKPPSRPRLHSGRRKTPHPHPPPQPLHRKALYKDVFGGGPTYSVPVLSLRTEDYLEIFGGFHVPSRSCLRVPVLDLPVAEVDQVLVNVRCGGFDYSEIFGRVENEDVDLMEFEVVSRSDDVSCGDVASSAVASTATMRKAMDEAHSQLKSTKGLMERRKDCLLCPEMSGTKSDANYMTKKGTLFVNSTCSKTDYRFQYDHHRVNDGVESSVTDKSRNIYGENLDEVMKGKVVEGAVRSEQIRQEKEEPTVHSEFVGGDRTGGPLNYSGGFDFFSLSKNSDQGSGIRGGMLGKEVFDMKENDLKSREWREARNLEEREVENKFVMIKEKENGVEVMEVSERKDLRKNEVIQKHSDTKHSYKVPQTAPLIAETHAGRRSTVGVKKQGGLDAVGGYVGVCDSAIRHTSEHVNYDGDLMVSERYAQFEEIQKSLLYEKTQEVVDQEEYERGPRADAQLSVLQNEEKLVSGSDRSAEGILHYAANDVGKEDAIELVQNEDRLPAVVELEKVKVLLTEHYPKERVEVEDTSESVKGHSKLNVHKPEDRHMEANQQNGWTKLKEDFTKNGEGILLNCAVEQKGNDCRTVNLSERREMEKMLKTAFRPEEKNKISNAAYQMEEVEKEPNEATKLEHIGNCSLESCRNSSTNESDPEQGTINESLKEAVKYVHTNETLAPKHEKTNVLEHENACHHEESVNESDDYIGWEINDEGLCEVVEERELIGFMNQAREKIPLYEVSVPHFSAGGQFNLENSSNSETRTEAIAPQVNRHDVQTDDGFNSETTELTEPMDERASWHSKQYLQSKRHGSDFFKSAETVHEEECVYCILMGSETAATAYQTNCSISCEEEVMEQEKVEFKDGSELCEVPLNKGKEISMSSQLNSKFDGEMMGDTYLPDLVDGTSQPEEKKEKRAIPGVRDTVRLSREQEAELERLRRIEEEKERKKEREKDRMVVDKAALEARERTISEARERFEKATVERATAEASRRAMMEARERLEKACAEASERFSSEKSATEERLGLERAAVERAIAEARGRAAGRAKADISASGEAMSSGSVEVESAQRCRARLERHQRTAERAAKALAEKNMCDLLAQREQAERSRLAETLDADVRRWSKGKEGNLRALLSTLQYILGPDCGWQPIPLTEVITSAAVKKSYRKATLCVHPDKLQQRRASIQQKYICEKVFDLLKEGWNKFNSEEG